MADSKDTGPDVTIEHEGSETHGRYVAHVAGSEHEGELTWTQRGEARIATHTGVPDAIGGQGIAARLVEAMVADAKEQGFTIVPQCSYVAAQFRQHPEWAPLRAETER